MQANITNIQMKLRADLKLDLDPLNSTPVNGTWADLLATLKHHTTTVALLGVQSAGKSSLINLISGFKNGIVPSGTGMTTTCPWVYTYVYGKFAVSSSHRGHCKWGRGPTQRGR